MESRFCCCHSRRAFLAATYFSTGAPIDISDAAVARMHEFGLTDLSGQHPQEIFSWDHIGEVRTLLFVILGGFWLGLAPATPGLYLGPRHHGAQPLPVAFVCRRAWLLYRRPHHELAHSPLIFS